MHLVTGGRNVSAIFRAPFSSEPWVVRILEHSAGYMQEDLTKFIEDESGVASQPRKGVSVNIPPEKRIWRAMHRMFNESLVRAHPVKVLSHHFQEFFACQLAKFPLNEWVEDVYVYDLLRQDMTTAATRAIMGRRILEVNPGLVDAFWDYERAVEGLAFGLPSWINRKGVRARNRIRGMCAKWYEVANREYDWENEAANGQPDWEPLFGAQISRELGQWAKSFDFSAQSIGAAYCLFVFA